METFFNGIEAELEQRLRYLYTLTEQGKFKEFDDLFYEYDRKYETAMEIFVRAKRSKWINMIKEQQSEQEKKEYISSLPQSVYEEIVFDLKGSHFRDGGKIEREFKRTIGKSFQEVADDLINSWEKYNPYREKKDNEFKDALSAGISLEEQAQMSQHFQESQGQDINKIDSVEKSHDE